MKKTKYISSGGVAFGEEKEMKKLGEYAKKGWILEGFAPLGYKLRKDEPKNIQYSLDYQNGADEEYFMYFEEAGWSHVCSSANAIHIFCAPVGTKPIYSDKTTIIEKYEREKKLMGKVALPLLITTVILCLLSILSSYNWIPEIVGNIASFLGFVSLVILVFPGMPYIAYCFKVNKLRK
ncbi:DUF2812 domain-containing protein [Bacillus sp. JJ864]|uniref:DUF2812 domain-containing protein n=1 Tax=Bacillus sp. JJ864 TaxID=3122975 RepID=UPI0030003689